METLIAEFVIVQACLLGYVIYMLRRLLQRNPVSPVAKRAKPVEPVERVEHEDESRKPMPRKPWAILKNELEGQQTVDEKRSERVQRFQRS